LRNIDELLQIGNQAQREKLKENQYKKNWEDMSQQELAELLDEEYDEVFEELTHDITDYKALKYECADLANACHMMILHCEREMGNRWHLPTKDVLNAMYENIDGLDDEAYWSSSESGSIHAWYQYMSNGVQYLHSKFYSIRVRAVRVLPEDHTETGNIFKIEDKEYQAYKEDAPGDLNWKEANQYCEELNK